MKLPTPLLVMMAILLLVVSIALFYNAYEREGYYTGLAFENFIESAKERGDSEEVFRNYEHAIRSLNLTLIVTAWVLLGVTVYLLFLTWLLYREREE